MYFKGALFLNTLRSVVDDDERWWTLIRDVLSALQVSKHHDGRCRGFFNAQTGKDLTPIFDQYLRHTALPTLELKFDEDEGTMAYRWQADERGVRDAGPRRQRGTWQMIRADDRMAD